MNRNLESEHRPDAIALRLSKGRPHPFLGDAILGAIDGSITTFAVVSGVMGANLPSSVVVIMGLSNLLADGFSMAASNYQKAKSDLERIEQARKTEEAHIEQIPDGEREEIRQIFSAKGLKGELLEEIVRVITNDRSKWVDTMMVEELGLSLNAPDPRKAGLTTFLAFAIAGLVPLLPFLLVDFTPAGSSFGLSIGATLASFLLIGWLKGHALNKSLVRSSFETFLTGACAALIAFAAGRVVKHYADGIQ